MLYQLVIEQHIHSNSWVKEVASIADMSRGDHKPGTPFASGLLNIDPQIRAESLLAIACDEASQGHGGFAN